MKNSYLIIIIFATLCANYSFGQSNKSPDNKDVFNAVANDNINILISEYTLKQHDVNDLKFYDNIQGNPYLPKNFTEGVININDKNIRTFFRYNMHTDEVEFKIKDLILILTEIPEETRIDMEDNTLIYLTYYPKNSSSKTGFLSLLTEGNYNLLAKKNVIFIPKDPPQPIIDSKPDRFVQKEDDFYIRKNNNQPIEIKSKKDLIKYLPELEEKIDEFLKTHKIKFKNNEDMIDLFKFLNQQI